MIYFIKCGDFVKIGYSSNVTKRMNVLQTASPRKLYLLSSFYGTRKDEKQIHRKFKKERQRGEWFNLTNEIREYATKYNGCNKQIQSSPEFKYADIVFITRGKYTGHYGSVMVTPFYPNQDITIGLRDRNTNWMRTFIISPNDLEMVQAATPPTPRQPRPPRPRVRLSGEIIHD